MTLKTGAALAFCALSIACAAGLFQANAPVPEPTVVMTPIEAGHEGSEVVGTILDAPTGKPVAGAVIVLQCTCLAGTRETMTTAQGYFAFRALPPGSYTLQVLYGQSDSAKVITLGDGVQARISFPIDKDLHFERVIT